MHLVGLDQPHHVYPAHNSAHALHAIRVARIRWENHKSDRPVGKEVEGEMPVPVSLPLGPECCRWCDGDCRAPKIGRGPQEEEHLTQRIGRILRPSLTFLFASTHQEIQPVRYTFAIGQPAASSKRDDLSLNLSLRRL
jgi:hypothetical protein